MTVFLPKGEKWLKQGKTVKEEYCVEVKASVSKMGDTYLRTRHHIRNAS